MDNYQIIVTDEDGFQDTTNIEALDLEDAKEQAIELMNVDDDKESN